MENPDELHEKHSDFSLISDKQPIDPLELSEYQTQMKNALKIATAKTEKLRQTFHPKKHYVVHYRNLKFFVEQGIKVTKIHHAIKFQQSKWLAEFVDLNTTKRQEESSKLDQGFFKLLTNFSFGKQSENCFYSPRRRTTKSYLRGQYKPSKNNQ